MARRMFVYRAQGPAEAMPRRCNRDFGRSPKGPGAFVYRNAPPPQGPCLDQTRFFTFLQSDPLERARQTPARDSKLRLRATWTRKAPSAWPGGGRRLPHPASPLRLLVCNLAFGAAMGAFYRHRNERG